MWTARRTSTFSAAQTRTIVAILLAGLHGVKADCSVDRYGNEHCTLSVAARVGLSLVLVFLLVAMARYMRYRHRRAAHIYIVTALKNQQNAGSANYGSGGGGPHNAPQYPPRVHGSPSAVPNYMYDPDTGFVPPPHSPPQYYTPPPGAPPKGPYHGKGYFPI